MTPLLALILFPLAAAMCCIFLHGVALRYFPKVGLLDSPERYGLKRARLPYPTGILAVVTFLLFFVLLEAPSLQSSGLIVAILVLVCTSAIDDHRPLPPLLRLAVQVVVGAVVFATGTRIYSLTNPLQGMLLSPILSLDSWVFMLPGFGPLPILSGLFTLFWIGLTINALNWFDGIPGQVSLLSTIGFLTIGLLSVSVRVDQPQLALLSFVLAGISTGCLLFDFPPPRAVMGDSGAMFFGLMLGVLTIYAGGKVATAFLVLGVPLIDLFFVVLRRIAKGRSPFSGSMSGEHLHHRLLARGWKPRSVVFLTASIGTLFGITALFLDTFEKFVAAGVLFVLMGVLARVSKPT